MINEEARKKEERRIMKVDRFQDWFGHKITHDQCVKIYDVIITNTEFGYNKYVAVDVDGNIIDEEID